MTNTRIRLLTASGLSLVLLCFCALLQAQDVKYNFDPGTDFSKYKTYKWVDVPDAKYPDQLTSNMIKQSIDGQLALKGLTKTDDDKADLYVAYQIAVSEEREWYATGYGGRYRTMGGMGTATSSTIKIGTLVFDMYDVSEKKQVWHGDATKTLDPSKDPKKNQEKMEKVAKKLLKNYPPPVKK
ncbi:MAG: hypothetical protein H6Q04_3115 [Acidobacteria bacterium]|jgi:hypothetical protein|nr:hypothetical protein [Acidobacteriota bacterium]